MNPKVEELISKKKEEIKEQQLKKREKHLISLGLTKDETQIQYLDYYTNSPDCKWDAEKKKYYIGVASALDVTDEEYAEICKYFPEKENPTDNNESFGAENTLKTIAGIILGIGLISTFVLVTLVISGVLPLIAILYAVILCMSILGSWAILRCIANISITLKQIKAQIK